MSPYLQFFLCSIAMECLVLNLKTLKCMLYGDICIIFIWLHFVKIVMFWSFSWLRGQLFQFIHWIKFVPPRVKSLKSIKNPVDEKRTLLLTVASDGGLRVWDFDNDSVSIQLCYSYNKCKNTVKDETGPRMWLHELLLSSLSPSRLSPPVT